MSQATINHIKDTAIYSACPVPKFIGGLANMPKVAVSRQVAWIDNNDKSCKCANMPILWQAQTIPR